MRAIIVLLIIFFGIFADYFINSIMDREKQLEALKSKDFDRKILKYYDNAIKEASDLIDTLSRVEDMTGGDLAASADLHNVSNSSNRSNPAEVKNQADN